MNAARCLLAAALLGLAAGLRHRVEKGKCLRFIHIPKNAGSSVEHEYLVKVREGQIPNTTNAGIRGWGYDDKMSCVSEEANPTGVNGKCHFKHPRLADKKVTCDAWHVPPASDVKLTEHYSEGACDTFCVVRHPVQKFLSEYIYTGGMCDVEKFSSFVRKKVPDLQKDNYVDNCHWVPQADYVYKPAPLGTDILNLKAQGASCTHVLKFENLTDEFGSLMADYGIAVSMKASKAYKTHCDLDLPADVEQIIEGLYETDYEAFGYKKRGQ